MKYFLESCKYYFAKLLMKSSIPAIRNSSIHNTSKIQSSSNINNSSFERYSYCGRNCNINNASIGSFCSISHNVTIGGFAHPSKYVSTSPVFLSHGRTSVKKKFANHNYLPIEITSIGHDVWIGAGAFIKGGVKIGNGAIIGMGSIVTKDIPDYAIVAGNPAKIIKMRFPEKEINTLLELSWWNWSESKLKQNGMYFNSLQKFINKTY